MTKITISGIIKTSLVTAFTIATALIWKDVILDIIKILVPPSEELFYEFLTAVFSTIIMIILIYVILRTEYEAEIVIKRIKKKAPQ